MKKIKLPARLEKIASFISPQQTFADIGSDHAYLPCFICLEHEEASGIAGEVREGPYKSACETIQSYGLEGRIEARLGSGLTILAKDEVSQVIIAGMGGTLITKIMHESLNIIATVDTLILQPNIDEAEVRMFLVTNGFKITNEAIVADRGHIYEIIVAKRVSNRVKLSEKELFFGPELLKTRCEVFETKWRKRYQSIRQVVRQIEVAKKETEALDEYRKQLKWIEELFEFD